MSCPCGDCTEETLSQNLTNPLLNFISVSVGGVFYGYGWEPQLAEITFYAMFLVPLLSMDPFFGPYPVPTLIIWAIRFYLFKIMLGAGLIKVKSSDAKWKPGNLSAMKYFYETQVRRTISRVLLPVLGRDCFFYLSCSI